jgi:beta-lactamase class C
MRYLPILLLYLSLLSCVQHATPVPETAQASVVFAPTVDPRIEMLLKDYDRFFADSMRITQTPGAVVVVVKDTNVLLCKGYGVRCIGQPDPIDINTVFRVGSLSKGFAGALTGVLVQEGSLKWHDPVVQYYPQFALKDPAQTRRIRLTHLLSHSTGLPYHTHTDMVENGYSIEQMLPYIKKVRLFGREGELFCYQNATFSVIGEVMHEATGKKYPELIEEKIFQPLHMEHASATYQDIMAETNRATPHDPTYNGWTIAELNDKYYNACPAGGINASGKDMGEWLKLLLGHRPDILSQQTLDSLFYPRIDTHSERRHFSGWSGPRRVSYAMGWRVLQRESGQTIVAHSGYVNGFRSEIALDRHAKTGICVLFNANSPLAQRCMPAFFERYAANFK